MNASAGLRSASGKAWDCVAFCGLWTVALAAAPGFAGSANAQDPPASGPAGGESAPAVFGELDGVAGVEPGMAPDELIDVALEAAQAQRLTDAQKILFAVARRYQENVRALQSLAYVYERQAVEAKADPLDPKAEEASAWFLNAAIQTYLYAAPLAVDAGDLQAAEAMYNTVLVHEPVNARAHLGLARVLDAAERRIQARERYETYLRTLEGEKDSQAHLELGRIYRVLRHRHLALRALEKAKELNPENPEILVELGMVYQDSNEPEKALDLVKKATQMAPSNSTYRNNYVVILLAQAGPRIAPIRGRLRRLRQISTPNSPEQRQARQALQKELDALAEAGLEAHAQAAIDLTRKALRQAPDDQELLTSLSEYYGTYQEVLVLFLGIKEAMGQADAADHIELSRVIQEQGAVDRTLNLHKALAVLTEAGDQANASVPYLEELARLQFEVYKHEAAAETCRRLLRLEPENAEAKRILARLGTGTPAEPGSGPEGER